MESESSSLIKRKINLFDEASLRIRSRETNTSSEADEKRGLNLLIGLAMLARKVMRDDECKRSISRASRIQEKSFIRSSERSLYMLKYAMKAERRVLRCC
jgi:hypothetical protein